MTYRPRGVTVLAVVFLITGVIGFSIGIWLGSLLAFSTARTQAIQSFTNLVFPLFYIPGFPANIFFLYAYTIGYVNFQSNVGVYQMETVGVEIAGMMYIFTAIGLFYTKRWGRYLALTLGTIMLIGGLSGLLIGLFQSLFIVGIIPFAFGIVTVWYLMGNVKYEFPGYKMGVYRPMGVSALAITLMIVASLLIVGGILIFTIFIPNLNNVQAFVVLLYENYSQLIILSYYLIAGTILIFGVLSIHTSIGLIHMKKWGHNLALRLGNLAIILGSAIFAVTWVLLQSTGGTLIGFPIALILLILGTVMDAYLKGDVKHEFQ